MRQWRKASTLLDTRIGASRRGRPKKSGGAQASPPLFSFFLVTWVPTFASAIERMNYWLVHASLRPMHSKFVATTAVQSSDPRDLDVSLAAYVPTFLVSWLVCRHGILQILASFGSRRRSRWSSGGFAGRSQSRQVAQPPSKAGPCWLLWLAALRHVWAAVRLDWVGCMRSRFGGQSVGDSLWLRWAG